MQEAKNNNIYDYDDDLMRFITEKVNQLQLLRQQQQAVVDANNNVKKAISAPSNNGHNKTNNAANKKGGQKQNNMGGMKERNVGFDQKTKAALKLNNAHLGGGGGESLNLGEGKRASDIGAVMNLAGFNGGNAGNATVLGGNSIGLGGFPVQSNMIQGNCSAAAAIPNGGYAPSMLMNMNGFNHPSPKMNMSMMQTRQAMQQQPQMMYHRSPSIPPILGYYYNHNALTSYPAANYSYYALPSYTCSVNL